MGREYATKTIELREILFNFPENVDADEQDQLLAPDPDREEVKDFHPAELAKMEADLDDEEDAPSDPKKGK